MNNKPYLIALNRIPSIGPQTILKLLSIFPSLEHLFASSIKQMEEAGISLKIATAIHAFAFTQIEEDLAWEGRDNQHILTWDDENYPALLKEIHAAPPVIYAAGNLACLKQPSLAMVGTRNPSYNGRETAKRFAYSLSQHGLTIVSGLARGIDGQVHEGALDASGFTIAVMGTGIEKIYPSQHRHLAARIRDNGLLLTEFPLKSSPNAGHFPRRNRIISGLSLGTLVVEAAIKSGSLITARLALEQNRDVFAIPGSIHNPQARGCHHLLQQGAKLVVSIEDILDEFGIAYQEIKCDKVPLSLAKDDANLVKCLSFDVSSIDEILARSHRSYDDITCGLANLELQGIIKAVPGGYIRCSENER